MRTMTENSNSMRSISQAEAKELCPLALGNALREVDAVSRMTSATFIVIGYFIDEEEGRQILQLLTATDLDTPPGCHHMVFREPIDGRVVCH
jgi:hypothetical protein